MRYVSWCVFCCLALQFGCRDSSVPTEQSGVPGGTNMLYQPPFETKSFSVFRPFFFTTNGDHSIAEIIGTGFLIRVDDDMKIGDDVGVYLLTALHLLSPEAGLNAPVVPGTLDEVVTQVVVSESFGASDSTIPFGMPLNHPLAGADEEYWTKLDLVAVRPKELQKRFRPLSFATSPPVVGDKVWLSMATFGGASASQETHPGEIVAIQEGTLVYRFENPELSLFAADGAPLLDSAGRVIGMHLRPAPSTEGENSKPKMVVGTGVDAERLRTGLSLMLQANGKSFGESQ